MWDQTLQYFLDRNRIASRDGAELSWSHAVNSRRKLAEARSGPSHMMEADVIMRGRHPSEPIMAHPPDTDSDITLSEWLQEAKSHSQGLKLDFKSLEALSPSLVLLQERLDELSRPVWINADILAGPGGGATPLDPAPFLSAASALPSHIVLSLGWTTGWTAGGQNPGYSWDNVRVMEHTCRDVQHAVTFPVRAALLARSLPQMCWLLQQSPRSSLTVWTGLRDEFCLQDLLPYRKLFPVSRIYYDLPEPLRAALRAAAP